MSRRFDSMPANAAHNSRSASGQLPVPARSASADIKGHAFPLTRLCKRDAIVYCLSAKFRRFLRPRSDPHALAFLRDSRSRADRDGGELRKISTFWLSTVG